MGASEAEFYESGAAGKSAQCKAITMQASHGSTRRDQIELRPRPVNMRSPYQASSTVGPHDEPVSLLDGPDRSSEGPDRGVGHDVGI